MKIDVYSLDGKTEKHTLLPAAFVGSVREDLIKRAVLSEESRLYQPKGASRWAGLETSARYRGRKEDFGAVKNKGIPHLPHEVLPEGQLGKVKRVPHSFKGRRAHPPKPQKIIVERMNHKEYLKALASALAAVAQKERVARRHGLSFSYVPVVLDDSVEKLDKTKDVYALLEKLHLSQLVDKAGRNGSKGILFVVSDSSKLKGARNLPGSDVVAVAQLQVRHLAPGTHAGRLTVFSEKALHELQKRFEPKTQNTKHKTQDTGHRTQNTRRKTQNLLPPASHPKPGETP